MTHLINLPFFYKEAGNIVHAAGKVRIDSLDKEGILNSDTRRLHSIRRYTGM